ncbi:MAG: IS110 family transposase, partial [Methyloprofundus sp.]|nr:IS110 family transposase [Methyloprofundus sp.]
MDDAVIIPHRLQALVFIEQLRVTLGGIKQFDEEIDKLARKHADYSLFSSLPGAGPSLAPRLLVAFGEQRERYRNAADL